MKYLKVYNIFDRFIIIVADLFLTGLNVNILTIRNNVILSVQNLNLSGLKQVTFFRFSVTNWSQVQK